VQGHASKRDIKKKTQTVSLLRKENIVIHTHGHTIIICCYLQRCITTVRIITILPREYQTGKRVDLDYSHRGSKILDTV